MMEINALFIAVLVILAVFMLLGFLRGIMGIVFGVVSWIFFFIFVGWANPVIYSNLEDGNIEKNVSAGIYAFLDEKTANVTEDVADSYNDTMDPEAIRDTLFKNYGIMLPEGLLSDSNDVTSVKDEVGEMAQQSVEDARSVLLLRVTAIVTDSVMKAISTLMAAGIALAICLAVFILIKLVSDAPLLGEANRVVGLVFGAFEGIMIVWILLFVISVVGTSDFGQSMMAQISNNMILQFLYDHNLISLFIKA